MFSSRSLSAAVEKGLGSFEEEKEEEEGASARAGTGSTARDKRTKSKREKKRSSPRRVQPRRRRLFMLRDVIHDWSDAETVKIFTALRKSMGSSEEDESENRGDDGRASHSHHHSHHSRFNNDRDDRVLIVGRAPSERPLRGLRALVESKGAQDADLLMLAIFGGGGAGERTREQTRVLLERAGLELVAVHPTRSWFGVTEARGMKERKKEMNEREFK
jgi:hypothetical protein